MATKGKNDLFQWTAYLPADYDLYKGLIQQPPLISLPP